MGKKVRRFRDLEFWAENGYVYVVHIKRAENADPKNVEQINKCFIGLLPEQFLKRAIAVGAYAYKFWEEYALVANEVKQFLQDAREVFREAKESEEKQPQKVQIFIPGESNGSKNLILPPSEQPKEIKPATSEVNPIVDILIHGFELC
jgi:hypothetical protein